MRGYKAFNKDLSCRNFQYEVGKTYEMVDHPLLCMKGFHFCQNVNDVFMYYLKFSRICEVEAVGEIRTGKNKSVTNKIKILREIVGEELSKIYYGSGYGDYNNCFGNGYSFGFSNGTGTGNGYNSTSGCGNDYGYGYGRNDGYHGNGCNIQEILLWEINK